MRHDLMAVEQTVQLLVIGDAMLLILEHSNGS